MMNKLQGCLERGEGGDEEEGEEEEKLFSMIKLQAHFLPSLFSLFSLFLPFS